MGILCQPVTRGLSYCEWVYPTVDEQIQFAAVGVDEASYQLVQSRPC